MKNRSIILDFLKGIAIIAVILYHAQLFDYGYLGVDIFLVIAGYLTTQSLQRMVSEERYGFFRFMGKRLVRLWPLLLLICIACVAMGYCYFLPANLKNCAEEVGGAVLFLSNFVEYITSTDYWDSANVFKPLMHTWYVGLLFQFYVLYALATTILLKAFKSSEQRLAVLHYSLVVVAMLSLALYLLPLTSETWDFYMLPSRLFEFSVGGLLVRSAYGRTQNHYRLPLWLVLSLLAIILLMTINAPIEKPLRLFIVVTLTCVVIFLFDGRNELEFLNHSKVVKVIAFFGIASYSLYLSHQPLLAFYRYAGWNVPFAVVVLCCFVLGIVVYYLIEKPLAKLCRKQMKSIIITSAISSLLLLLFCYNLYAKQGVVRDIPTLDIYVNDPSSYVIKDYCDRNYSYNHDFPKNTRKNILVIGDSFGRDWINVLREGGIDKDMNISYISGSDSVSPKRIKAADYIFIAYSSNLDKITPYFPLIIVQKKFWIVGTKNFGKTSSFYLQLPSKDYKRMVALPRNPERSLNIKWKQLYGKHYIDMMGLIQNSDGKVPVFTPDGKFFSFDGSHLSRGGAIYYAQHLPLREYFQ